MFGPEDLEVEVRMLISVFWANRLSVLENRFEPLIGFTDLHKKYSTTI